MIPAVLLVVGAGGGVVWASVGSTATHYRTSVAATGDVEQLLTL
ncbi:MAG: hypothetical protein JWM93_4008, partial [Frankiales bacterium]|nr:hypothetical protein [Frankiales bacterium]